MDERSPDSNFIAADRSQGQPDGPGSDVPDRLRCLWDGGRRGSTDERCWTVNLFYIKFAPGKIKQNYPHQIYGPKLDLLGLQMVQVRLNRLVQFSRVF